MLIHRFLILRTLYCFRTIFDIDTDAFEEKPWKYPGVDISDFFNFGLDEEKWKDFCKQLVSLLFTFAVCSIVFLIFIHLNYDIYITRTNCD
jgi:hypothetical protein